ncbi:bestrophin family protein, partial [Burkholderia sp. E168m15]
MIVRPREHWLRMLLVWNGSVLPTILPQLVLTLAISLVAVWGGGRVLGEKVPLNPTPFTLIGLTLAIFAGFRNNASYERYREGRQLWGGVLTATRTLVSQALCYGAVDRDDASRRAFVRTVVAFVYTLKHQLRGSDPAADLRGLLDGATYARVAASRFRPVVIVHALREAFAARADAGQLADTRLWMLDARLDDLVAMVSGCERIASTPIPFSYDVLLHRTIYAYCVLLPFGLVDSIGAATPFVTVFVAYTLIALDA